MDIIITTSQKVNVVLENKAIKLAQFLHSEYIPRKDIVNLNNQRYIYLVVTKEGLVCHHYKQKLFYHPSMAMLRLKRIHKGEEDILTSLCEDIKGLKILDCTLGFGSDSLVFSYLVGINGQVTALEKSPLIYSIVNDGFKGNYSKWIDINLYTGNVNVINEDYVTYLKKCPNKSFDIVYFDPMFDKPIEQSIHLDPLRFFAEEKPLDIESINQAIKVATKKVIIKNHKGFDFSKLGITKVFTKNASKVQYGVIEVGE